MRWRAAARIAGPAHGSHQSSVGLAIARCVSKSPGNSRLPRGEPSRLRMLPQPFGYVNRIRDWRGGVDAGAAPHPHAPCPLQAAPSGCNEVEVRREEALDVVARLVAHCRAVHGRPQRGAARQADRELADQLLQLVERQPVWHFDLAHLQVAQQQLALVGRRRLVGRLAAPQLGDALRISIGTPEQNQRVLAALDAKDAAA